MNEPLHSTAQSEAWRDLVSHLPGVLNAEFVLSDGQIREVHILSDQSRAPKQIVRDVQSAMAARFRLELDHRIISVAQIPSMPQEKKKRLVCERLAITTTREGSVVTVALGLDGQTCQGEAACGGASQDRCRAIAQATVNAINQFLSRDSQFSLIDWKHSSIGDSQVVLVGLRLKNNGKMEQLLGACYEGEDVNLSAVMATLDAVNRRILALHFSTPS